MQLKPKNVKERLVLDILGDSDMSALEIVDESGGLLGGSGIYILLGRMVRRGLVIREKAETPDPLTGLCQRWYHKAWSRGLS